MENQERAMLQVILLDEIKKNVQNNQTYNVIFHLEDGSTPAHPIYWLEVIDSNGVRKQLINRLAGGEKGYVTKVMHGIGPIIKMLLSISPDTKSITLPIPSQD